MSIHDIVAEESIDGKLSYIIQKFIPATASTIQACYFTCALTIIDEFIPLLIIKYLCVYAFISTV